MEPGITLAHLLLPISLEAGSLYLTVKQAGGRGRQESVKPWTWAFGAKKEGACWGCPGSPLVSQAGQQIVSLQAGEMWAVSELLSLS